MVVRPVFDGLVAHAGGTQAVGLALQEGINRFVTVASAADSATLPSTQDVTGEEVIVINAAAANAMTIYPAVGEKINALTANTGLSVAANKTIIFYTTGAGQWHSNLTA
jgi:hypothetical protein